MRPYWHHTRLMYEQLPMRAVSILPDEMSPRLLRVAELREGVYLNLMVRVLPKPKPGVRWGHRMQTLCPVCNTWQSHGRMNQHFPACSRV